MSFPSELLECNALSYGGIFTPLHVSKKIIKLKKQDDGRYGAAPNQIVVKIYSASLNPIDIAIYNSRWIYSIFPFTQYLGKDYAGIVEAIGIEATKKTGFKVGDKVNGTVYGVFGLGTVSEYFDFDIKKSNFSMGLLPENQSFNQAAAWPLVFGTAYQMVTNRVTEKSKILVIGAGTSVGRLVISLCKILNANEIVVICSPHSENLVKELGASSVIDYTKYNSILNPVLESSKEGLFDYIFDCTGNRDLLSNMKSILKPKSENSEYITIVGDQVPDFGSADILSAIKMVPRVIARKISEILGISSYNYKLLVLEPDVDWPIEGKKLFEENKIQIAIDSIHKFNNFQDAVDKLSTHQARGKVIIQICDE